jgi:hypothetical protein
MMGSFIPTKRIVVEVQGNDIVRFDGYFLTHLDDEIRYKDLPSDDQLTAKDKALEDARKVIEDLKSDVDDYAHYEHSIPPGGLESSAAAERWFKEQGGQ